MKLPQYRSHKVVQAAKIQQVVQLPDSRHKIIFEDESIPDLIPPVYWLGRYGDESDPGYYVRYEDGYESWSPSKAFEEGYTRIKDYKISPEMGERVQAAQQPSIGRTVHYHGPGHAPNGEAPSSLNVPPLTYPADVVAVHGDGMSCTLWVKTHIGFMILPEVPYSEEPKKKHWSWPPRV